MPKSNMQYFFQQMSNLMPQYCDKCGHKHSKNDIDVLNEEVEKIVCKLECMNCHNVYIFHVQIASEGMMTARRANIKGDISSVEMKKFSNQTLIENDEILDVFSALQDVNDISDFDSLFKRRVNN